MSDDDYNGVLCDVICGRGLVSKEDLEGFVKVVSVFAGSKLDSSQSLALFYGFPSDEALESYCDCIGVHVPYLE